MNSDQKPEDEQQLVKLYMELTGTNESDARCVFMHLSDQTEGGDSPGNPAATPSDIAPTAVPATPEENAAENKPKSGPGAGGIAAVLLLCGVVLGKAAPTNEPAKTASPPLPSLSQPLTLGDAVNIALKQNPAILKAQKDLEATQGIVVQTRAIVMPKVTIAGSYGYVQPSDIDILVIPGAPVQLGNNQSWVSQIKLVQSIYEGGRLQSSLRMARLTKEQSVLNYQTTVADTVLAVELGYFDVLLAAQQITVQEASVELLTRELQDTTRRFDAGTVPRFNVLRAEVELANARPKLIHARNSLRISKNDLANLLGYNLPKDAVENIPLTLAGKLEAEPYELDLPHAIAQALEKRTELGSLRKAEALRKEDIVSAKAGYRPSVQAYGGYDAHNSMLRSDIGWTVHGWIAGAQVTWNIFDGLRTQGQVKEATANYERAGVELDDAGRRIELEVRTSHSNFIEAREVLESQKKVVEEAEEALRLARARSEAGTGTQLDVLSAQTALTDARTTEIQALHDYEAARARLERSVGTVGNL